MTFLAWWAGLSLIVWLSVRPLWPTWFEIPAAIVGGLVVAGVAWVGAGMEDK